MTEFHHTFQFGAAISISQFETVHISLTYNILQHNNVGFASILAMVGRCFAPVSLGPTGAL